jgi:hypothetical protein
LGVSIQDKIEEEEEINEAVKAALDERFAQQEQAVSAAVNLALAEKVDTGITDTGITLGIFGRGGKCHSILYRNWN